MILDLDLMCAGCDQKTGAHTHGVFGIDAVLIPSGWCLSDGPDWNCSPRQLELEQLSIQPLRLYADANCMVNDQKHYLYGLSNLYPAFEEIEGHCAYCNDAVNRRYKHSAWMQCQVDVTRTNPCGAHSGDLLAVFCNKPDCREHYLLGQNDLSRLTLN